MPTDTRQMMMATTGIQILGFEKKVLRDPLAAADDEQVVSFTSPPFPREKHTEALPHT